MSSKMTGIPLGLKSRLPVICRVALILLILAPPLALAGPPVRLIAHRGFTLHHPENSLAALSAAMDLGLGGAEVDLRTTKDGRIVLMHDATLHRTTGCKGLLADMTWEQVRFCRLRDRSGALTDQRVPLFKQALDLVKKQPGFQLALDAKQVDIEQAASMVVAQGMSGQVQFFVPASSKVDLVRRIKAVDKQLKVCIDLQWWWKIQGLPSFVAKALKAEYLLAMEWSSSEAGFAEARKAGAEVVVYLWGNNNLVGRARQAADMGAAFISCDRPDLLIPVFHSRQAVKGAKGR